MRSAQEYSLRVGSRRRVPDRRPAWRRTQQAVRLQVECLEPRRLLAGIQAFHRSGQTFVTWQADAAVARESYHV